MLVKGATDDALVNLMVLISDGLVVDVFVLLGRILETYHGIGDVAKQIKFQTNNIFCWNYLENLPVLILNIINHIAYLP